MDFVAYSPIKSPVKKRLSDEFPSPVNSRISPSSKTKSKPNDVSLNEWKEYSTLKSSENEKITFHPQGRNVIVANALREYSKDVSLLSEWADKVQKTAKELGILLEEEIEKRKSSENIVSRFYYLCFINTIYNLIQSTF